MCALVEEHEIDLSFSSMSAYERCLFDKVKRGFDNGAILEEWLQVLDAIGGLVEDEGMTMIGHEGRWVFDRELF